MLCSSVLGKSVTNFGITKEAKAPDGTNSFSVTGPVPSGKLPTPCAVPSTTTAVTVAQITNFSSERVGVPATSRLFALK